MHLRFFVIAALAATFFALVLRHDHESRIDNCLKDGGEYHDTFGGGCIYKSVR